MERLTDKLSGDEMGNTAYPHKELFDGAVIRFHSFLIEKKDEKLDLPEGDPEEGGQEEEKEAQIVIDFISNNRLNESGFDSLKEFMTYIKFYVGKVTKLIKANPPAGWDEDSWKQGTLNFVNFLKTNFKGLQFFTGESRACQEGSYVFALDMDPEEAEKEGRAYDPAKNGPDCFVLKHAFNIEKC